MFNYGVFDVLVLKCEHDMQWFLDCVGKKLKKIPVFESLWDPEQKKKKKFNTWYMYTVRNTKV